MWITMAPLSLLSYYVSQQESKVEPVIYRVSKEKELASVIQEGSFISPLLSIVEYKGKPPKTLTDNVFNEIYLSVTNIEDWISLRMNNEWLKVLRLEPEMYKGVLNSVGQILEEEAADYLWDKYRYYPKKIKSELLLLLMRYKGRKFTLEELMVNDPKELASFQEICLNLGSLSTNHKLVELSSSKLFQLLIGSDNKPPFIYYHLMGKEKVEGKNPELCQALQILRESVLSKKVGMKTGALTFNTWVSSLEKEKINNRKFSYKVSYKELNQLESNLKGILCQI